MKLYQLFERTIRVPQELKEDILRMVVYAVYQYHKRGAAENDVDEIADTIENVTGYDMSVLDMEMSGRFKRSVSAQRDFYGITLLSPEDVPYYHSSQLVRRSVDVKVENDAIVIDISMMVREEGNSLYINHGTPHLLINANGFSGEILEAWFNDNGIQKAVSEFKKLATFVDHELQHLVQDLAFPEEQSKLKKNYSKGGRTEEEVDNDYFTSPAEIRPQLANIERDFRRFVEEDEWWDRFTKEQKKQFFMMFVGLTEKGFNVEVGTQTINVSIPPKRYFKALKDDVPKLHIKIVKDFYGMIKDLF